MRSVPSLALPEGNNSLGTALSFPTLNKSRSKYGSRIEGRGDKQSLFVFFFSLIGILPSSLFFFIFFSFVGNAQRWILSFFLGILAVQ